MDIIIRPATDDEMSLDWFDHTKLSAINTCPTWGIIRYGLGRTPSQPGRVMALEAGAACHDVFAGVRLFDALTSGLLTENVFTYHGERLFGHGRLLTAMEAWTSVRREGPREQQMAFCLSILDTTDFYDDPNDKRRTMSNLEEACIRYIDQWKWGKDPIWIEPVNDPDRMPQIGIELPFNYTVVVDGVPKFRFTGKIDAIHNPGKIRLHENKTASRLDEAWEQSFLMSHQITGYMSVAQDIVKQSIDTAIVHGLGIPQPKTDLTKGLQRVMVTRREEHYRHWIAWMLHTVELYNRYASDPVHAPRYTHSCNRYFRPCAMIPWCDSPEEDQREGLETMYEDMWNPLHSGGED